MSDSEKRVFRPRGLARAASEDREVTDEQLLNEVDGALAALANMAITHSKQRFEQRLAAFRRLRQRTQGGWR